MTFFDVLYPVLEITIIAVVINYFLYFFNKLEGLVVVVVAFVSIFGISSVLGLPVLSTLINNLMSIAAIGLIIIVQPELRAAISRLNFKGKGYQKATDFDKFLEQLVKSVYRLATNKAGALIVLEKKDNLDEFAQKSVVLNAKFSPELLETIFVQASQLHDGAVILRDQTLLAAAVILPLPEDSTIFPRSAGTRHRAAFGMSLKVDACVIAVSESGKVSLAHEGNFSFGIKEHQLLGSLKSHYETNKAETQRPFHKLKALVMGA